MHVGSNSLVNETFSAFLKTGNVNQLYLNKTNNLKKMGFWNNILFWIPFRSEARKKSVHQVVSPLILHIEENLKLAKENPELIQNVFFNKIAKLKYNPFQNNLDKNSPNKLFLSKELQNVLSSELSELRILRKKEKAELELKGRTKKGEETLRLKKRIAKAKLAIKLGSGIKKNGGTTGSVIVHTINGKPIGIFKISIDHLGWSVRLKHFIQQHFCGQLSHLSTRSAAQSKAEVLATKLDRRCGFNLAPNSAFVEINGQQGAFLEFLKDYKEAKHILLKFNQKETYLQEEIDIFQKMVIYDYLIGNLDRHEENWFVRHVGDGDQEPITITEIRCIDNANSFIKINPGIVTKRLTNQYKWKKEKIAQSPFSEGTKAFIRENLTPEKIDSFISEVEKDTQLKDLLEPEVVGNFKKRLSILQHLAQKSYEFSPAQLGLLTTDDAIDGFLNEDRVFMHFKLMNVSL